MLKSIKIAALAALVSFSGFAFAEKVTPSSIAGAITVNAEQVIEALDKHPNLNIIDSRKAGDFNTGHIEGARNLVDTDTTAAALAAIAADKSTPLLFYCNGQACFRGMNGAKAAVDAGYTTVYWFRGGIEEWNQKGFPLVR